ncbi:hypothetical protein M514_07540 [Trichuris suis]|uniref:Uncharacterized protein n=1 Tax=Trichuris suis TaxID=68888 RepID=A0A085NEB1_9BILA|nr:hypothetical protein M513_07540 [Trichuris suis]KFD67807.1 hypothetical protein M514_07540 [Trichuris suis]
MHNQSHVRIGNEVTLYDQLAKRRYAPCCHVIICHRTAFLPIQSRQIAAIEIFKPMRLANRFCWFRSPNVSLASVGRRRGSILLHIGGRRTTEVKELKALLLPFCLAQLAICQGDELKFDSIEWRGHLHFTRS